MRELLKIATYREQNNERNNEDLKEHSQSINPNSLAHPEGKRPFFAGATWYKCEGLHVTAARANPILVSFMTMAWTT